ncbi:MAG TPA: electron transport complex subunit RsxE [Nitrospirae bacterium]|nr:electron transport complex protein RnfE [bacterium BMS3Abin06]HDH12199.1 electron transport complex subunit RsxE [Nitrospirota bacterium]HDZ03139.1 electron transport complex subunit RsxE [Nitrospirota bacterium]
MSIQKKSNWELLKNGMFGENTIFRMAISLCPSIAVTNGLKNGVALGISVMFVQTMVNITISAMRKFIHPKIRIPIFMLVIAGYVTIIDMLMATYARTIYREIGLYIQIIVAFASIFARAEVFASKNKIVPSLFDGLGMGIGFLLAMIVISFFRELLGKGELFGYSLISGNPLLIMILPAGGFLAVGLLMGFFNWVDMKFYGGKGASGV